MKAFVKRLCVLVFVAAAAAGVARPDGSQASAPEVCQFTLSNGSKLLVVERDAPVVACQVWIKNGSVDDPPGMCGAAHLIEHMLFKGTRTIGTKDYDSERPLLAELDEVTSRIEAERAERGPDAKTVSGLEDRRRKILERLRELWVPKEYWDVLRFHGASGINASTSFDWTAYYYCLPANRLEVWAHVESDRFSNAVFREFYSERDVVLEEMRSGVFDDPWGRMYAEMRSIAFTEHPYRRPVIGFRRDVACMNRVRLREWFRKRYCGANMTLVVVGGVKREKVKQLCERYFARRIPRGEPARAVPHNEPEQRAERRALLRGPWTHRLMLAWHRPCFTHPDFAALELTAVILSGGRSSRLYRRLVDGGLALEVNCWNRDSRYDGLFLIRVGTSPDGTNAEAEKAVLAELRRLSEEGPTKEEMKRALGKALFAAADALSSCARVAWQLGYYETVTGDWRNIDGYQRRLREVSVEDVKRVVRRYLRRERMNAVLLEEAE